jgi:hypothetical protein
MQHSTRHAPIKRSQTKEGWGICAQKKEVGMTVEMKKTNKWNGSASLQTLYRA